MVALLAALPPARAASVTVTPVKDTTIYSDGSTPLANAKGVSLFAGRSGQNRTLRSLVKFDLAGQVPAGATVTGVVLTLAVTSPRSHPLTLGLHRLSADWGEGTSDASRGEGGGVAATAGDATWLLRFHGTGSSVWTAAGGDFAATASATQSVPAATGNIALTSASLVADVQAWLANSAANFGWLLRATDETAAAARFSSREGTTPPSLQITYTEPAVAPTITAQPQNTLVTSGQPATFSVTATGTGTLTYQWRRNGLPLAGATTAAYTIPSAKRTDADYYDMIVTNSAGSATSFVVRLSVAPTSYPTLVAPDPAWELKPAAAPNSTGAIETGRAIATLPDGRAYIAGRFVSLDNTRITGIARLAADGSLDSTFSPPEIAGDIGAVLVQPDGRIVIGGDFTRVGGIARMGLARLNEDGSVDAAFSVGPIGSEVAGAVFALARLTDGRLLVGGNFLGFAGTTRRALVRLTSDGSLDTTFQNQGFGGAVLAIVQQSDGKVIVGGNFSFYTAASGAVTSRSNLARLNADGTLDTSYSPATNSQVNALAVQSGDALLVGGSFSTVNGAAVGNFVRLIATGAVDGAFGTALGPGFNGSVNCLALDATERILVGGSFTSLSGTTASRFARLTSGGARDSTLATVGFDGSVISIALLPSGTILFGGHFIRAPLRRARSHGPDLCGSMRTAPSPAR